MHFCLMNILLLNYLKLSINSHMHQLMLLFIALLNPISHNNINYFYINYNLHVAVKFCIVVWL